MEHQTQPGVGGQVMLQAGQRKLGQLGRRSGDALVEQDDAGAEEERCPHHQQQDFDQQQGNQGDGHRSSMSGTGASCHAMR
ncbi:hypothetical protein D3C73_1223960 [compost metagenome]